MRHPALEALARAGLGDSSPPERLHGGDMSEVWATGDFVVKTSASPPPDWFIAEARGLDALAAAGAPVPQVLHADEQALVLERIPTGPRDEASLARALAALHRSPSPLEGAREQYGWDGPVFLGRFPLTVGTGGAWATHLRERRLEPLLRAASPTLGGALTRRTERFVTRFDWPAEGACLVHGDLWSGNVVWGAKGPVLVDPSAQGAERALDLAMMQLFGGFGGTFWRTYRALAPVPAQVDEALRATQLVFLLVHVVFFGAGYNSAVGEVLGEYGA